MGIIYNIIKIKCKGEHHFSHDSEDFAYAVLGNGVLYKEDVTTEELLALVCDGVTHYFAFANWK